MTSVAPPSGGSPEDGGAAFDALRPRLIRIAYRMLGSVADAEDVVQDAWLRWQGVDHAIVQEPEAYLRRTVTRLSIDVLKSARRQRETYIGPWLPDPVVEDEALADDVTLPLMLALERLSPLERAAFLLHDVFGQGFDEIAVTLGRDSAACRQLAARARAHVRTESPRFTVAPARGREIATAFFDASRSGDMGVLSALLTADVAMHSDGGGVRPAAPDIITGADNVLKLLRGLAILIARHGSHLVRYATINGLPGFVSREGDGLVQTTAFQIEGGRIAAIYIQRNPEKLRHLEDGKLH